MKKSNWKKPFLLTNIVLGFTLTLGACGTQSHSASKSQVNFEELQVTGNLELDYAKEFTVTEYGSYELISVENESSYFVVPEGMDVPYNLPEDTLVLQQPLDKTYLVATSAMDLIRELGALDMVKLSGTQAKDWYVEEAKAAMEEGRLIYAGKYSAPDYELLLSEGCNLAIESTMIHHNPEAKEKLEEINIPVFVERSSYESHPLGRLEWIKLYGVLYDKEKEAQDYFNRQLEILEPVLSKYKETQNSIEKNTDDTSKKVAFFYVTSNGAVNVRKPNDYIAQMISMAGGSYALKDVILEEDNALSTMNMQMEDFYAAAKDADILIYNSTIDGELENLDALFEKSSLFEKFDAVKAGNVYCTSKNFFQESTGIAEFIRDMNLVIEVAREKKNSQELENTEAQTSQAQDLEGDYTYLKLLN